LDFINEGPCSHFSGHSHLLHLQWPLITKGIETPGLAINLKHFSMHGEKETQQNFDFGTFF